MKLLIVHFLSFSSILKVETVANVFPKRRCLESTRPHNQHNAIIFAALRTSNLTSSCPSRLFVAWSICVSRQTLYCLHVDRPWRIHSMSVLSFPSWWTGGLRLRPLPHRKSQVRDRPCPMRASLLHFTSTCTLKKTFCEWEKYRLPSFHVVRMSRWNNVARRGNRFILTCTSQTFIFGAHQWDWKWSELAMRFRWCEVLRRKVGYKRRMD
jgi:hypothetical protein